ncbi:MAG: hypothetical protein ACR2IE_02600 [Candidatus Sumerlaeaceae bacterium]
MQPDEKSEPTMNEAAQRAAEAARKAREYAQKVVAEQKGRAATGLGQFGSAIRDTASRMRDERDLTIAGYAEAAAAQIEKAAGYFDQRDLNTMLTDAQRFARRRPELVVGGMFVAGVAIARFLKASGPNSAQLLKFAGTKEDTYVPQSMRKQPAVGMPAGGNDSAGRRTPISGSFSSPRAYSAFGPDGANSPSHPIEAAGADLSGEAPPSTPQWGDPDGPGSNPEAL